jgi:tetratricopeptide (TPR) repeat protein
MRLYETAGETHAAARAASWLAVTEQGSGRIEQALRRMEDVYAMVGEDEPDADLVFLVLRLGQAHYFAGNPARAGELIERGLDLAEALQLPEHLCRGWTSKAVLISPRRPEEARSLFQLARDQALAHQLYTQAAAGCASLSDLAFRRDQYSESLDHLDQALAIARRIGHRPYEWFTASEASYDLTMLGRWDEALARFGEIPDEQIGKDTDLLSPVSGVVELYLQRGQLDQARQLLNSYDELCRSGDTQAKSCYQPAVAAVRLAEGNHQAALAAAELAVAAREHLGIAHQGVKLGFLHALEAALGLGDEAKLRQLLTVIEAVPAGLLPPFVDATAHRFRAQLAGDDPGADRHFTAAIAQLRASELPFHLAVVQLEHGEWLTARGRPEDAQSPLAEAGGTFERLGATPWIQRLYATETGTPAEVPA